MNNGHTNIRYRNRANHDNHHANYTQQGSGQPVLLLHGMAASLYDWEDLGPHLSERNYSVYALDLLGHGDSAKPVRPQDYHAGALFDHFERWVDELDLPAAPILVGHSMGGYLSLLYALRRPQRVRALALIAPFYTPLQLSLLVRAASRRPALGERALRRVPAWLIHALLGWDPTSAHFSPAARLQIALDYKRASPHIVYLARTITDLTPELPGVQVPTLAIWGERDHTLHPASFPRLVREMPAARGCPLPGCGHQPHIGQPERVGRLILEFLEGLER